MSRLLAIETSFEACSVALGLEGSILVREYHQPRRHAELLLPAVRDLLSEGGVSLGQLDAIAFGRGPGSFTSLRIGISAVQGLAWGADLGVVPVSSLAALALGAVRAHATAGACTVIAAMDARMEEVFHAAFRVSDGDNVHPLGAEAVSPPGEVKVPGGEAVIGAGNGFDRYPALESRGRGLQAVYPDLWPSAREVVLLAERWLATGKPLAAHLAQPVYVRDNVAEKSAS